MTGDPVWMKSLLTLHVGAGFGAFLLTPMALVTAKGGKAHKRWGMAYLWCMGIVAATALPMALYRPVLFLAMVAVFSFYLGFSAYRVLRLKELARGGHASFVDWFAACVTLACSLLLVLLGWLHPATVQNHGLISIIFGLIGTRAATLQLRSFIFKPKEKMFWWYTHFQNFIGSYIATWTAFSVVTLPQLLGNHVLLWLWPTAIGVPCIIATTAYYRRKFARRERIPAPALAS